MKAYPSHIVLNLVIVAVLEAVKEYPPLTDSKHVVFLVSNTDCPSNITYVSYMFTRRLARGLGGCVWTHNF